MTLCLAAKTGFSQTDFREGYIITNAHDSIPGWIAYREGAKAFSVCDFQKVQGQGTVNYTASDIAGYGIINDKSFSSKSITVTDHEELVFLEVLVKGPITLYNFKGTFWLEKENKLYVLKNELKEVFVNDKRFVKSSNEHIATLNILLADCAELRNKIQNVALREKPLSQLIKKYNGCKGQVVVVYKEKKPWFRLSAGVAGGLNISRVTFKDEDKTHNYMNGTFTTSFSPVGGLSFGITSPRVSERLSLNVEAFYTKSKYSHNSSFDRLTYTENNSVDIELTQLKVPVSFRYTLPKRKFTPYFSIGAIFVRHLNSSSTWLEEIKSDTQDRYYYGEAILLKYGQFGIWAGTGISKPISNKLSAFLDLRYERTNGIVSTTLNPSYSLQAYLNSHVSNLQVTVGISMR